MADTVETAIYRLRVEGQEQLGKLKSDLDGLTVSEERATGATRTTTEALERRIAKLDPLIRAQQQYTRELQAATRFAESGVGTESQRSAQVALATQRYNTQVEAIKKVEQATGKFATQTGLARHELINLSRQAQDIGVSLASGQSPLTVLVQQGSQVADVFASSAGSVRGFFTQAIGWAARFAFSAAGAATAVASIGIASVVSASQFTSSQREIDRALSGIGAASGADRGGINRIAQGASSAFGLSVSEATEAATAFAATGRIYGENIERATLITKQFAQALGLDVGEAAKKLATDLQSPSASAEEWAKKIAGIDADTIKYIRTLENMGNRQAAIDALILAAAPGLARQAEHVGTLSKAWDAVSNSISNAFEWYGRMTARNVERATGADLGGFSDQERLSQLRRDRSDMQQRGIRGPLAQPSIRAIEAEIDRLEKKFADLATATADQRFASLSNEANAFARAANRTATEIENLSRALATLQQYQDARQSRGLGVDPGTEQATQAIRTQTAMLIEQEQVERNKAQYIAETAIQYQGVGASTAVILANLQAQLGVAQAVTGAAAMEAQQRAVIVTLLAQGKSLTEATAIAEAQRAVQQAQINASADQQLVALQQQAELLATTSEEERNRVEAAQTYNSLLERGVDTLKAQAIAQQQFENAETERRAREEASAEQDAARAAQQRANAAERGAAANAQAAASAKAMADAFREATKYIPGGFNYTIGQDVFQASGGGYSQFDPAGYQSTSSSAANTGRNLLYGQGNYDPNTGMPNQRYWDNLAQQMAQNVAVADATYVDRSLAGSGVEDTITSVINGALGPILGERAQQYIGELSGLVPQDRQQSVLEQYIARVQQEPVTLAREQLLRQLTDSLDQLKGSVDNLSDVFSPFYSQDPRRSNLGFRAFAGGGIMTPYGELPLRKYNGGGIANSPQVALFGEGSTPEAYVPVPNGRIPVEMTKPANNNERPITLVQNFNVPVTRENAAMAGKTAFQGLQEARRMMGN